MMPLVANHCVSHLSSIIANPSSNPQLSTQTVVPNTFCPVGTENGEHSYGEYHNMEDGSNLMEIDWGSKHNNTDNLHQPSTSHAYHLNKCIHHHETNNPGLILKEIDWGPKQVNLGVHYSVSSYTYSKLTMMGNTPMTFKRKSSFILWITEICPSRRVGHFKAPC